MLPGEPVGERPRPARPPLGVRPLPAPGADAMGDVTPMVGAGADAAHDLITPALYTRGDMVGMRVTDQRDGAEPARCASSLFEIRSDAMDQHAG